MVPVSEGKILRPRRLAYRRGRANRRGYEDTQPVAQRACFAGEVPPTASALTSSTSMLRPNCWSRLRTSGTASQEISQCCARSGFNRHPLSAAQFPCFAQFTQAHVRQHRTIGCLETARAGLCARFQSHWHQQLVDAEFQRWISTCVTRSPLNALLKARLQCSLGR